MSTKKQTTIPQIEELKLSDIALDLRFSGRTEAEIKRNVKELSPVMEAHGFWDAGQPGQYFESDGKKVLCAGFTRYESAKSLGFKVGYFTRTNEDKTALLLKCVTTNQGKPVSAWKQGERFAQLRDGESPEAAEKGAEVLAPMKLDDIAKLIGKSRQHVSNCVAIFEETPAIAELIVDGKIAANVAWRARQLVKDDDKRLKMLHAAIKHANGATATPKHLDAVKNDFVAPKKLKAAATQPELPATGKEGDATFTPNADADKTASGESSRGNSAPSTVKSNDAEKSNPSPASKPSVQSLADLGGDVETVNKTKLAKYRKQVVEAIAGWDAGSDPDKDAQVAFEDAQIESLADAICKVIHPF